ncbi:subunit 17 of mediator complex-domain-containing protein [Xylariales sp. PMI_506]|nr:subunit 17 of mediator complex-domain-containing protein [Xylariales sp. PMI_506]
MASAPPFSLRPWPTGDKKPKNLQEFIARVNYERGGFRHVSEEDLREEIKAKGEGRVEATSNESDGESDSEDEDDKDKKKNPMEKAAYTFNENINKAQDNALLALDFVSLLLSKEMPNQANATLSTFVRDKVGFGVLGATKLQDSNITPARLKDDMSVATGWRLMGINKMVDSVVASAERLEKEISLETKYWADVLAVSEKGWSIASLPREPHTLGVRFGFAEAVPEFRDINIAPLRRNDDGTVRLDRAGKSQRLRAVIERNGQITGRSLLPRQIADDAPLQDRVLEARNTIFAQELWYELNKEARMLLSLDIRSTDAGITYNLDSDTKITLSLEDLAEPDASSDLPDSQMANTIILGLHFLLIFCHRLNYFKRTHPSQHSVNRTSPPYSILRPLISRLKFDRASSSLIQFLSNLTSALTHAGIDATSTSGTFQAVTPQLSNSQIAQLGLQQSWRATPSESLIINLAQLLEISTEFTVTPNARIYLRGRSFVSPLVSTQFMISLPGATSPANAAAGPAGAAVTASTSPKQETPSPNPLQDLYPPYTQESYPNVDEVIYYVRQASIRAIVEHLTTKTAEELGRDDIDWTETMHGAVISDRDEREARIDISDSPAPTLTLHLQWLVGEDTKTRLCTWTVNGHGQASENIQDIVLEFFKEGGASS